MFKFQGNVLLRFVNVRFLPVGDLGPILSYVLKFNTWVLLASTTAYTMRRRPIFYLPQYPRL